MSTEVQVAPPITPIATQPKANHYLIARDPQELATAHVEMRVWARGMVEQMTAEAEEHRTAFEIAKKNRWGSGRLERLYRMSLRRKLFYEKTLRALEDGYLVVPNFQMDTFMVRTAKKAPTKSYLDSSSWANDARLREDAQSLPVGEGQNRNPETATDSDYVETVKLSSGAESKRYRHHALRYWRPIQFPIALAKSAIMSDAAKAAAVKVFDELGVAHDSAWSGGAQRKGDPMILGRLRNPRARAPDVTFFIAWAIDLGRI